MPTVSRHGRSRRRPRIDAEWCPRGTSSNVQHDQFDKSDADQQHRKRHVIVFEPMPIIGKHHVDPSIRTPRSQRRVDMYRTPVSDVLRRKGFWFRGLRRKPGSVSRFAAKVRPAFRSLWRESDVADASARSKRSPDEPKAHSRASSTRYGDIRVLPRTSHLFSCYPPRCIDVGRDLTPNDVDVAAQIIQLV